MSSVSATSKTSKDRFETGPNWATLLSGDRREAQNENNHPVRQIKKKPLCERIFFLFLEFIIFHVLFLTIQYGWGPQTTQSDYTD